MNETPIRSAEMVREIRDKIYVETKHLSREELKEYFRRESAAMWQESEGSAQPSSTPGARARRRGTKPS